MWCLGKDYFQGDLAALEEWDEDEGQLGNPVPLDFVFTGCDRKYTRRFLEFPLVKPAVQFTCCVLATPYEDALEKALRADHAGLKLQALVVLMKVHAARSVPLQWRALGELKQAEQAERWGALLEELARCFSPGRIELDLKRPPSTKRYRRDDAFCWTIRAAGVRRFEWAIPRLVELSICDHLDTSLAAERSLEDFHGPRADDALLKCLLGWRYDAFVRAGRALLRRNKELLNEALSRVEAPPNCRYNQGLLLARCDNPLAVPILCAEVPRYQIIDTEMFAQIARLARPEHLDLVKALPRRVRRDQREKAEAAVEQVVKRLQAAGP